jgi:hypothetical protein
VRVKSWEIIADNLSKAEWSWGCVSALDSNGRTIWIAYAHRGDGKRYVVRADEKLTAFLELESAIFKYVSERGVDHIETMDGHEILKSVDRIDKLDKIGRRTFGLDDAQTQVVQTLVIVNILDA